MRVFLAGATGVLGIRLVALLVADGHTVAGMTRSENKARALAWEPPGVSAAAKHELERAAHDGGAPARPHDRHDRRP